ncbi:NAD(P)-dependent alcohol dehydrogenase [Rhodococcus sp. LB1]|uniref:NAD(P)-dependent alcohol dehydrogenase n=1 Tax=Rhodococcus sp. LB1 TaxID=1807499 RepID=UPI00077A7F6B|nr:NAD(P)-dependent alcohol dehydrogenase [Rhodococcus sp. LB1]KXX59474.1 alcohol dehydrogenase [Rhodococcus sp. LB1]RYE43370.1 MAG: NAD(P)-dependent alcohol dehydrogenase [Hyphomicrobiales bacterium]
MKTTAAVLRSAQEPLSLEELDIDELRPREVLVRIVGSGICHTDLGVIATAETDAAPIVLGHEGSGIVTAVGHDVDSIEPGDHVVLSYNFCAECDNCARSLSMHCRDFVPLNLVGGRLDGSSVLRSGGEQVRGHFFGQSSWATYAVANEQNCVRVARNLPLELLAPLGCGIQTGAGAVLNTLNPEAGSSIAIFGTGSVGLAALLGAVVAGCGTIIAVDIQPARLAKAADLGATHTINSAEENVVERIREITGGVGAQYSVDCIGLAGVIRSALECLQSPGVCATVGFQGIPNEISFDQGHLLFGRSLIGVIEGDAIPQEFVTRMIDLYQAGKFPFTELIDTFEFGEINEAIEAVHQGKVTKAVLTFDEPTPANGATGE